VLKRSFSSAVIALLSGARERIGFDTEKRGFLLTKKVPYHHDRHEILNFLSILTADGIPITDDHLEAWLSEDEISWATRFLTENEMGEKQRVVGIHPFTANMRRAWHEDNFIDLANHIQRKQGARVIIFGGKREIPLGKTFHERIDPPPIVAVGKTSLRESMALLSKCALLICNDSGIMHLGAALKIPLIALFGPQSPVKFGPFGDNCTVVYKHFDCSPCQQKFFTECDPSERMKPMCMETITTEEIIGIVDEKMSVSMTRS
jgi:heptosyltransferase-2